jgi:D-3-phosphoglycerate dehydrogenase
LIPINKVSDVRVISLKEIPETLNQLTSAAEFSFGLLIALVRNVVPAVKSVELGNWNRLEFPGMILNGKNLGVIGFGRIGRAMASYAKCFGLNVGYYDPYIDGQSIEFQKFASINELVSISDIVSLHVPYDSARSKIPILSRENFLFFKQGSFFINTSRGELIDEDGLIYAIQSGVIKGVALDVIRNEPNVVNNKIFKFAKTTNANVIFTPHIAGYATENVAIAALGMLNYLKLLFNQDVHE